MPELTDKIRNDLGHLFICGFLGYEPDENIKELITKWRLRNIILMRRNIRDATQARNLVKSLQDIARQAGHDSPLLIGIDQECGLVSAFSSINPSMDTGTLFPGAMTVSATNSTGDVFRIAESTAKELHACGIGWVFAPDADVNNEPENPVIGSRSYGDEPHRVADYAAAFAAGMRKHRVACSAKHFPGHGDLAVDSHISLPQLNKTHKDMLQNELPPFKHLSRTLSSSADSSTHLLDLPIDSIMTAHMALPKMTPNSFDLPATINNDILNGFLRYEMEYDGVIVTDCLEMEGVQRRSDPNNPVGYLALKAGADVSMICNRYSRQLESIKSTFEHTERGDFDLKEIEQKADRIRRLRGVYWKSGNHSWEEYDLMFGKPDDLETFKAEWGEMKPKHLDLSQEIYKKSVTVVRDSGNILPLRKHIGSPILLLSPKIEAVNIAVDENIPDLPPQTNRAANDNRPIHNLERNMQQVVGTSKVVHQVFNNSSDPIPGIQTDCPATSYSAIIFVTRNSGRSPMQYENLVRTSKYAKEASVPLIVVASCVPYDVLDDPQGLAGTYLTTYEYTPPAMSSLANVLFGNIKAEGRLPLSLGLKREWAVKIWKLISTATQDRDAKFHEVRKLWTECFKGTRWEHVPEDRLKLIFLHHTAEVGEVRDQDQKMLGLSLSFSCYRTLEEDSDMIGSLALVMVRPDQRRQGIGSALHSVALSNLRKIVVDRNKVLLKRQVFVEGKQERQIQLGSIFPRIWPGVPADLGDSVLMWFRKKGWKFAKTQSNDLYREVSPNFEPPNSAKDVPGWSYRTARPEDAEELMVMQRRNFSEFIGWPKAYEELINEKKWEDMFVGIKDGKISGALLTCLEAPLGFLWPETIASKVGIIACVGIDSEHRGMGAGSGLLYNGMKHLANRGANGIFIDWVVIDFYDRAGFKPWATYDSAMFAVCSSVE